jgi:hypothetical protein
VDVIEKSIPSGVNSGKLIHSYKAVPSFPFEQLSSVLDAEQVTFNYGAGGGGCWLWLSVWIWPHELLQRILISYA